MARVTIEFEDRVGTDGSDDRVAVSVAADPPLDDGAEPSTAQRLAIAVLSMLEGGTSELKS